MDIEILYKKLYIDRKLFFKNVNVPEISEQDLKDDFDNIRDYIDNLSNAVNNYKKVINYKIKLKETDCPPMRKVFIAERLKEADTRNRATCLYTLYKILDKIDSISLFITLLDKSSYFINAEYRLYRDETFHEVQDIRDLNKLKKYIIDKMDMNN
ncbi:hypothetical protein FDF26_15325 [Clostridium botulinum]|nr:hypothetical protein [Clostridium botulinum]